MVGEDTANLAKGRTVKYHPSPVQRHLTTGRTSYYLDWGTNIHLHN
jgi:hypothetical protein